MYQNLKNLAEIISGYTFRGPIESCIDGEVCVVQPGNIRPSENIDNLNALPRIRDTQSGHKGYLKGNDVLLVVKSMKSSSFRSCVFTFDSNSDHVLVSSSAIILRVNTSSLMPQYLSLFLNSGVGQRLLSTIAVGEYVSSISKKMLEELTIPVPNLIKQMSLVNLAHNLNKQKAILEKEISIKENLLHASFQHLN